MNLSVQINGDTVVEGDETFTIRLTGASNSFTVDSSKSTATGTILNDDSPLPNLTINDVSLNEGNAGTTTFTFTVSLSAPAGPGGVTFDIATADGTAQDDTPTSEDNDYVAKSLTGQTIPAGSSTYAFNVLVNGDTAVEPNETFFVNVTNVTGANPTDGQGLGNIQNDDLGPDLTIDDVSLAEGDAGTTTFTFTVSLSAPAGPGGVTFDIATDDDAASAPPDYVSKSLVSQTIPAGASTYAFAVVVVGDRDLEDDETFIVNVTNVVGANAVGILGTGTILNDDVVPNLSIGDVSLAEGGAGTATFTFTVSLSSPALTGGVTFDIATADGTAQDDNPGSEDNDYVAKSLTGQTIPAGSSTYTFDVTVNGDTAIEPNETFFANVTNVTGATVTDGQGQGTIQNDDTTSLTVGDVTLNEGNAGTTTFTFTASLSAPAGPGGVTFDIATADGTATTANSDYTAKSLTGQTIPAGSSTYTFDVLVNGDATVEPNETFFVNITNVAGIGASAADGQALGTITNDDAAPPPPNLTIDDVSLSEGNAGTTTFTFTVSLSAPAGAGGVTFDIATADGTATAAASDYTARSLTGQTIPAGSSSYTFDVPVNGDTAVETNETFVVNVANVVGATPTDAQGQGTIQNDDTAGPLPSLSINDVSQSEGSGASTLFTFTVSLSAPAGSGGVSFAIATADNTATVANGDYAAKSLTGQTIPAGSSSYTFDVTVNGDTAVEPNETFFVNVTNAIGATVADGQGQGTIQNDDATGPVPPSPPATSPGIVVNTAGDDDTDNPPKETDEQRQQRQHTNRSNKDDVYTEGNVIAVRLSLSDPIPVLERGFIAEPNAVPYILIGNKDGVQQITLQGDAAKAGSSIRVGDYVQVDGTKESEVLFRADEIDVTHRR